MGGSSAAAALLKKGPRRFGIEFEVPARAQGRLGRRCSHKEALAATVGQILGTSKPYYSNLTPLPAPLLVALRLCS